MYYYIFIVECDSKGFLKIFTAKCVNGMMKKLFWGGGGGGGLWCGEQALDS